MEVTTNDEQEVPGREGNANAYHRRCCREAERQLVEQAEAAYARFVANSMPR